jgi:hypothetical protein
VSSIPYAGDGSNLHVEVQCMLECGHDRVARLKGHVMLPDAHGVPRERHVRLMRPDELAQHVPRLRCRDCIEAAYPELRRLGHSGRYDECDCSPTDLARIAAHENGEQVQPIAPWADGSVVSR